jgi:hypothetical protein
MFYQAYINMFKDRGLGYKNGFLLIILGSMGLDGFAYTEPGCRVVGVVGYPS